MEIDWQSDNQSQATSVPAAKMHVLGLQPLKQRLGPKWERLSGLVHKLFKKAIAGAQSSGDRFIMLDELTYAVTFVNLSVTETQIVCNAIAKEVCELLFGDQIDEISVRSLVAEIVLPKDIDEAGAATLMEKVLERDGIETVTTQSHQPGSRASMVSVTEKNHPKPALQPIDQIRFMHAMLTKVGLGLGFFPVWELRSGTSNTLFLAPYSGKMTGAVTSGRPAAAGMSTTQIIETEIELLKTAGAYASRIRDASKICAVGVGVSYGSLSSFHARIRYITALQKITVSPSTPLIVRVEQVPEGVPDSRLGEMIAMLRAENVRIIVEFQSLAVIPSIDIRLGASGFGGVFPAGIDGLAGIKMAEKLIQRATAQKASAFIDHIDTPELLVAANQCGVRLGTGAALYDKCFTGLEDVPHFPLTIAGGK